MSHLNLGDLFNTEYEDHMIASEACCFDLSVELHETMKKKTNKWRIEDLIKLSVSDMKKIA